MGLYQDKLDGRRKDYDNDQEMRRYLGTLSPQDRAKYLRDRQQVLSGGAEQPPAQQPAQQQNDQQAHFNAQALAHAFGAPPGRPLHPVTPNEQAHVLGGMIDDVTQAWSDENDSRVAQAREMRRMQHAKDIEAMRQEGLLRRLSAMQQPEQERPVASGLMRWFNPETGQWENTDSVRFG